MAYAASTRCPFIVFLSLLLPAYAEYAQVDPARVMEILSKMTLQEKLDETGIALFAETDFLALRVNPLDLRKMIPIFRPEYWFDLKDNERLGMRGFRTRDGPRGITCLLGGMLSFGPPCPPTGASPSFPHANLRSATWDVALEEEFGAATGETAQNLDIHAALLPCINILPWLNAGRSQESYGEDPFFNGKMGAATVRGVQSKGVMATPKHFLANNIENTRWMVSADMDDKTLHEVYLKQWAILIAESSPEFIMTSYNRVQGNWSNVNPKFIGLLREKLGFQGSIMTDWLALMTTSVAALTNSPFAGRSDFFGQPPTALTAGVDMEMPYNSRHIQAVRQLAACEVEDAEACHIANMLDRAVAHLLRSKLRYGLVGAKRGPADRIAIYDDHKFAKLALKIARRGIVLLKNEGSFLPKRPADVSSVVVLGSADELELGDHGSSAQKPSGPTVTVLQGLIEKYGASKVQFLGLDQATSAAVRGADMVVLDVGTNHTFEGEYVPPSTGGDRQYLTLHPHEAKLVREVISVNSNVVVAMTSGANMIVEDFVNDVKALLWLGYPGPLGGRALADVLSGETNPSGRMTSATPKKPDDWVPPGITLYPWAAGAEVKYPYAHGFKHMWQSGIEPRFPMGWGLSYTTFSFGAPALSAGEGPLAKLTVRVAVKNTGALAGIETVQVYATCPGCKQQRLPVLLVGFAKVQLDVGAEQEVSVGVSPRDLAIYDAASERWLLEKAEYKLLVGPCLAESSLQALSYEVESDVVFDYEGAKTRPHVPGAEARECSSFKCQPDQEFNTQESNAILAARTVMAVIVLLLLVLLVAFCCMVRCCCRWCCRKASKKDGKSKPE